LRDRPAQPGEPSGPPTALPGVSWRWFDLALGLSVLSWAGLGLWHADPTDRLTPVRLAVAALNGLAGVLLLLRGAPLRSGTPSQLAAAVPAFIAGGAAVTLAPPPHDWRPLPAVVFVAGAALVALSLGWLGRNFAILPARRALVTGGPYRLIRHPAYAGELAMVLACALAGHDWWTAALAMVAVPAVAVRIQVEERVMAGDPAHAVYAERVRWRLVPGLW